MEKHGLTSIKAHRVEVAYVVTSLAVFAVLAVVIGWLVSDREPNSNEMTLAYRKNIEDTFANSSPKDQLDNRQRLIALNLVKQRCEKIDVYRYQCVAKVLLDGHPVKDRHAAGNAIYRHDGKGWRFEPAQNGNAH